MSHTTTINSVEIKDIQALKAAIRELQSKGVDCSLLENQVPKAYYANQAGMNKPAAFVLTSPSCPYDVGFYWNDKKTSLDMRTDLYSGHVAKVYGNASSPLGKIQQTYSAHAVTRQAAKQGYRVSRKELQDGSIKLTVTGLN